MSDLLTVLDENANEIGTIEPARIDGAILRATYEYWLSKCVGETLPPVSAIDPLALPRASLPYLNLIGVEPEPLRFRFRLSGTDFVDQVGSEMKGTYVDEVPGMERTARRFRWMALNRRPYFAEDMLTFSERDYKRYRAIGMPFVDTDGAISRMLFVHEMLS